MRKVRTGPVIGLIVQLALLAALAATVGLGAAGWVVGVTYGVITAALLTDGLIDQGADRLGPADRVTLDPRHARRRRCCAGRGLVHRIDLGDGARRARRGSARP